MAQTDLFRDRALLSAELHYFRIPLDGWELMLARLRQLGANTISTYVPWAWHEPRPGALDFTGTTHPQRNLVGFVRLCGALGFRVILKPGPYVGADLLGGGIPAWLLHQHPEIHALRSDRQPWRHSKSDLPRACYLHPVYLAAAQRWIASFSAAMLALQSPAGPVVALQADNATPGNGMLPAAVGQDPRFRLDYNEYVAETLWPRWLAESVAHGPSSVAEDHGQRTTDNGQWAIPRSFQPPTDLAELRRYADLDAFTDWYYTTAVAAVAGWLREQGWATPIYHTLQLVPWEASGTIGDLPALARATGWLGGNFYGKNEREPSVSGTTHQLSFEEYVHQAFWRTRLLKHLSPDYPAFIAEISGAQDFSLVVPFVGAAEGANVFMAVQTPADNPAIGAWPRWASEAPIRRDGSVRPRFWNVKLPFTLLAMAGADFANARAPADLALGYSHVPERAGNWGYRPDVLSGGRPPLGDLDELAAGCDHATRSQLLAQRLVRSSVAFDVLDLDAATPAELARYALVVVPATTLLARATQAKLASCRNLVLVGPARTQYDENLEPCAILHEEGEWENGRTREQETSDKDDNTNLSPSPPHSFTPSPLRLPADVSGEQLGELAEERGGVARYGWADVEDVDVSVRYGADHTYLFIANRRTSPYNGTLAYRGPEGDVLHLHLGLGGRRIGVVMLRSDEVVGAALGGDAAQGGWRVRGARTSVVFNGGAGVVVPCDSGLVLSAPQSGTFQIRRPEGWDGLAAYRLLLDGRLLPAAFQTEATHMSVPYIAEDEHGQTDLIALLPRQAEVPEGLHSYLAALLGARAAILRRAALAAEPQDDAPPNSADLTQEARAACLTATETFTQIAGDLEGLADRRYTLDEYSAAWAAASVRCRPAIEALALVLARARGAHAAGTLAQPVYQELERQLVHILGLVAQSSLGGEHE